MAAILKQQKATDSQQLFPLSKFIECVANEGSEKPQRKGVKVIKNLPHTFKIGVCLYACVGTDEYQNVFTGLCLSPVSYTHTLCR